jgi:hypothetical protein
MATETVYTKYLGTSRKLFPEKGRRSQKSHAKLNYDDNAFNAMDSTAFTRTKTGPVYAMRTPNEIASKLAELRQGIIDEGHVIDEVIGEIYALEYVLGERSDL